MNKYLIHYTPVDRKCDCGRDHDIEYAPENCIVEFDGTIDELYLEFERWTKDKFTDLYDRNEHTFLKNKFKPSDFHFVNPNNIIEYSEPYIREYQS